MIKFLELTNGRWLVKFAAAVVTLILAAFFSWTSGFLLAIVLIAGVVEAICLYFDFKALKTGKPLSLILWYCKVIPVAIILLELTIIGFTITVWSGILGIITLLIVGYFHYYKSYKTLPK